MHKYSKILVTCPGNAASGGPEALHYLVHSLTELGLNAFLVYIPWGCDAGIPDNYRDFKIKVGEYDDTVGNLIIFPEIFPNLALAVKHAQAAIWWLSVDGFLHRRYESEFRNKLRYLRLACAGRRPWRGVAAVKKLINFTQSEYANEYLRRHGVPFFELFEPINPAYLLNKVETDPLQRHNEILYNPKKGMQITQTLVDKFPHLKFTPLQGLTRSELYEKFSTSKIYIDFGNHAGRDRLPREAAIHGCCVVTGLRAAAKNSLDVSIPDRYKLSEDSSCFYKEFSDIVNEVFHDFGRSYSDFEGYRQRIRAEPFVFKQQITTFFGTPSSFC